MQQRGSEPANQDAAALVKNFMRNLRASRPSEAASAAYFQELSVKGGAGVQIERDGSNR